MEVEMHDLKIKNERTLSGREKESHERREMVAKGRVDG